MRSFTQINLDLHAELIGSDPAKSKSARDTLITANVPLVTVLVGRFLKRWPQYNHLQDDLIAAGRMQLVVAVDRMQSQGRVKKCNPTAFISRYVQTAIRDTAMEDGGMASSFTYRKANTPKPQPAGDRLYAVTDRHGGSASALREEVLACCLDDIDRQIVRLLEDGHTVAEAAEVIGVSKSTISDRRAAIHQRYLLRPQ